MANSAKNPIASNIDNNDCISLEELHEATLAAASGDAESVEMVLGISFSFAAMFATLRALPGRTWFKVGRKMGWIRPVSSMTVLETLSMMAGIAQHLARRAPAPVRLACSGIAGALTVGTAYAQYLLYRTKKALIGADVYVTTKSGDFVCEGHIVFYARHKEGGIPLVEILTHGGLAYQLPADRVCLRDNDTRLKFAPENMKAWIESSKDRAFDKEGSRAQYAYARFAQSAQVSGTRATLRDPVFEGPHN